MREWKVRRVDAAELVLVVEDVLAHATPRPLVQLTFQRVEGETTLEIKGNKFAALPAAAAAYVAGWMNAPYVVDELRRKTGFQRADTLVDDSED